MPIREFYDKELHLPRSASTIGCIYQGDRMKPLYCVECERGYGYPERWQHELQSDGTYRCTGKVARVFVEVVVDAAEVVSECDSARPVKLGRKQRWDRGKYNAYMREYRRRRRLKQRG